MDNSRGYQTRGRSMGPGRGVMNSSGSAQEVKGIPEENL